MDKDMRKVKFRIADWIRMKVQEAGAAGAVIGLSGGIDSSVVAGLAKEALGENVLGVIIPCHSIGEDSEHARMVADKFGIRHENVDISRTFDTLIAGLPKATGIAPANLKPRLRMATLYYFANMHNYIVLGTDNKAELMTGYFTKYGDGGVDLLPIASLYKREVREMARILDVPEVIITKPPSAGLWEGQTDEGEMGITYDELDAILQALESGNIKSVDPTKLKKVRGMISRSEHKRKLPDIFSVS
jgi:NAD+ synthase